MTTTDPRCALERLDAGRYYLLLGIWLDAKSTNREVRIWAWRQLSALDRWTDFSGEDAVHEELVLLAELARLMVNSPRMED